ncbi:MAG: class I SAM-dependent methyltransferase [Nitrospira sp.]|nr:class I SAM-dependent methyltransferase [Candidatus Brocadiales bacterium]MBL7048850.1 class I SAM-dependent methyltransferase [Nitrospira sp.]
MNRVVEVLKKIYNALPKPPSTNYRFHKLAVNPYELLAPSPVIFDIGSKSAAGSYAFGSPPSDAKVVCVDIEDGPNVDLVADAHDMHMVDSSSVDCVICFSVLEHVHYPVKVMKEIYRILKPGGLIYINIPFLYPFHAVPHDYYRFTFKGIEVLCEDFERLDSGFNRGPASTMHQLLVHFFAMLFCFNNQTIYNINIDLFKWVFFWVKYLDKFLAKYQMAYVIHSSSYFIGRKV